MADQRWPVAPCAHRVTHRARPAVRCRGGLIHARPTRRQPASGADAAFRCRQRVRPPVSLAGVRRRRFRLGPVGAGGARIGTRLGRDRLRQPGQPGCSRRVLQRSPGSGNFVSGRARGRADLLHGCAARVSGAVLRIRALRRPVGLASPSATRGSRRGGRDVRRAVDHPVLRPDGDAQPVVRPGVAGRRGLLPASRQGKDRRQGARRPRCGCGSGRPHATLGRLLPGPASGRGGRGGPGLAARGRTCRARGRPSPRLGTVDHRGPTALRRRDRPVAPRQRDSGRPGPTSRRRRSDSSLGRADPVPPVRGALEAPDHRGVVVRAAAVHGGRHHRRRGAAPPPSSRPWSRRPWRRPTCS